MITFLNFTSAALLLIGFVFAGIAGAIKMNVNTHPQAAINATPYLQASTWLFVVCLIMAIALTLINQNLQAKKQAEDYDVMEARAKNCNCK